MLTDVRQSDATGIPVLVRRNPAHEVVALRLYARGGSTTIGPDLAGADLLYARTARRGTARFPKELLNAELARLGTEVGCRADEDLTVFHLRCLRRHFERSWELFTDVVLRPRLDVADLELVRRQMLLGIRQRQDDPDARLVDLAREFVYAGHPYAPHPEGTEASVGALDAAALRAHAEKRLVKSRLLCVAVGDVDADDIGARLGAACSALPTDGSPLPVPPPFRFAAGGLRVETRDVPTHYVLGQFAAPSLADADHPAAMLLLSVLRDRLFEEVRTKRNLSYAPGAGLGSLAANLGWIYVTAVEPARTLGVMRQEMRRLRDEPLTPKELQDKVQVYVTRYHLQNETNQAQAGFLARYALFGGGWEQAGRFVSRLEALHPADVQAAAVRLFHHIQYVYLGDPDRADPAAFVDP